MQFVKTKKTRQIKSSPRVQNEKKNPNGRVIRIILAYQKSNARKLNKKLWTNKNEGKKTLKWVENLRF